MPSSTLTPDDAFTVPSGISLVVIELEGEGAQDTEDKPSGDGGRVRGEQGVTSGDTLYVRSSPGGTTDSAADAGGDSVDIRVGGTTLSDRIAVAAGGGGAGNDDFGSNEGAAGGDGGPDTGQDGDAAPFTDPATGGTQSAGGSGGVATGTGGADGQDGSFGPGGDGATTDKSGGGGGAGWYGGGGGASADSTGGGAGGAGGSNYDDGLAVVFANERGTSPRAFGNGGRATIEYVAPPSNVSVDVVRYRSADLSWDSVAAADEYRVYRDGSPVATTTSTSYTDSGLSPTTTYDWYVRSVDGGTEGGESATVTGTTGGSAPGSLTATAGSRQVDLSWTDTTSDEDGFEVHRATSAGVDTSGTPVATLAADTTAYTDTGLDDGVEYHYRVVATRNGERGNDSAEVADTTALPAPTGLTADAVRDTEIDVSWSASHNNGTTRVEARADDSGTYQTNTTVAFDVETATLTGLLNGQLYGIRVVADTTDAEQEDQ